MRALFLGLGGAGQRHLRNLRGLFPDASAAAVRYAGRSFEITAALQADHSVDLMSKYEIEALSDIDAGIAWKPDIAIVSSPSSLHVRQCSALARAGIATLVEKPLAIARGELDELRGLLRAGPPVAVGYTLRYLPCVLRLKEWLEARRIGRIQSVEIAVHSNMPAWHPYEKPNEFYAGRRDLGGGVILTEIHEIDLLCWLLGRPVRVAAVGGTLSEHPIDVEDTVGVVAELPGGVPVTLTLSFVQAPPSRRFAINGSEARISLDIPRLTIVLEDASGAVVDRFELAELDRNRLFVSELKDFIGWAGGAAPSSSLATVDSASAGETTAFAMKEALASRQMVSIAA